MPPELATRRVYRVGRGCAARGRGRVPGTTGGRLPSGSQTTLGAGSGLATEVMEVTLTWPDSVLVFRKP
jgi:hypothetical protein